MHIDSIRQFAESFHRERVLILTILRQTSSIAREYPLLLQCTADAHRFLHVAASRVVERRNNSKPYLPHTMCARRSKRLEAHACGHVHVADSISDQLMPYNGCHVCRRAHDPSKMVLRLVMHLRRTRISRRAIDRKRTGGWRWIDWWATNDRSVCAVT